MTTDPERGGRLRAFLREFAGRIPEGITEREFLSFLSLSAVLTGGWPAEDRGLLKLVAHAAAYLELLVRFREGVVLDEGEEEVYRRALAAIEGGRGGLPS